MTVPAKRERTAPPTPRSPGFTFEEDIPRHWLGGNVAETHIANGVNLLFPAGERFFVRSVRHFLDRITDPHLRAQVKGFAGQEGRHARAHERFFERLEAQGYDVSRFLRLYERLAYDVIERLSPPELRLSATAACEHYTALIAEDTLRTGHLERAHPEVRRLLMWHAAEEIEHRAVAFDVLQAVNPSYALRMAGMAVATVCLGGFWALGTLSLLAQDRAVGAARLWADLVDVHERRKPQRLFASGLREYMRPDFHPLQKDTDRLARQYLASVGLA